MPQPRITCTVRFIDPSAAIIDIVGEINAFAETALMDSYAQASSGKVGAIILNFGGLEYMNSSGIGLLVTLLIRAQRQGQKLLACGLGEHYLQIFELTRLNEAIALYPNEDDAIAALKDVATR
jgi:anti-sigma B factor antagonist